MTHRLFALLLLSSLLSCSIQPATLTLPFETEFFLLNLTRDRYLTVALRDNDLEGTGDDRLFVQSPLIPPGAVMRRRFFDLFPATQGCPDRLDLRVHLYKQTNPGEPVGRDPTDPGELFIFASAEFLGVSACDLVVASTYTIVLRETETEPGDLVFVQDFGSASNVKTIPGKALADLEEVPPLLESEEFAGQILQRNGTPLENIGVLLRTRYRVAGDDTERCPDEPVGRCYSAPIAYDITNEQGRFSFDRPPGAYMVEPFADGFLFRPGFVILETPLNNATIIAERE